MRPLQTYFSGRLKNDEQSFNFFIRNAGECLILKWQSLKTAKSQTEILGKGDEFRLY